MQCAFEQVAPEDLRRLHGNVLGARRGVRYETFDDAFAHVNQEFGKL